MGVAPTQANENSPLYMLRRATLLVRKPHADKKIRLWRRGEFVSRSKTGRRITLVHVLIIFEPNVSSGRPELGACGVGIPETGCIGRRAAPVSTRIARGK
jgi:hypothetical protein